MKFLLLLVLPLLIDNINCDKTSIDYDEDDNSFIIPRPGVCKNSKKDLYANLIKRSNRNFILAYQKYMPQNCSFSSEVVKFVEDYRNAANYVVIFLNKPDATDAQFHEIVKIYNSKLLQLNEAIRKLAIVKNLSNICYKSLMLMQRAISTTGEGLVAATIIAYNKECGSTRRIYSETNIQRPITFDSNYLN